MQIGALLVDDKNLKIDTNKCIGCLLCLSSSTKWDSLENDPTAILSAIIPDFETLKNEIESKDIFNGSIFNLPIYGGNRNITSFSDFTSKNETKHISLWACSILKFLSSDLNARIGKEIDILKMGNPRDGRLDVCVISEDNIIICEAKTTLDSLLSENNYRLQIPSYTKECSRILENYNTENKTNKKAQLYLLVGGEETDLFPPDSPLCTSIAGNKGTRFYRDLIKYDIKFISANALWLMILRSAVLKKKLCWDLLFEKIFSENSLGLLTAGIAKTTGANTFVLDSVKPGDLKSSETSFS